MAPLQSPTQVPLPWLPLVSKLWILVSPYSVKGVSPTLFRLKELVRRSHNGSLKKIIKLMQPSCIHPEDKESSFSVLKTSVFEKKSMLLKWGVPWEEVPGDPRRASEDRATDYPLILYNRSDGQLDTTCSQKAGFLIPDSHLHQSQFWKLKIELINMKIQSITQK